MATAAGPPVAGILGGDGAVITVSPPVAVAVADGFATAAVPLGITAGAVGDDSSAALGEHGRCRFRDGAAAAGLSVTRSVVVPSVIGAAVASVFALEGTSAASLSMLFLVVVASAVTIVAVGSSVGVSVAAGAVGSGTAAVSSAVGSTPTTSVASFAVGSQDSGAAAAGSSLIDGASSAFVAIAGSLLETGATIVSPRTAGASTAFSANFDSLKLGATAVSSRIVGASATSCVADVAVAVSPLLLVDSFASSLVSFRACGSSTTAVTIDSLELGAAVVTSFARGDSTSADTVDSLDTGAAAIVAPRLGGVSAAEVAVD